MTTTPAAQAQDIVTAQHDETGRMCTGERSALPPRYSIVITAAEREARMREALEFYAEAEHWERGDKAFAISIAVEDKGYRARRALAD